MFSQMQYLWEYSKNFCSLKRWVIHSVSEVFLQKRYSRHVKNDYCLHQSMAELQLTVYPAESSYPLKEISFKNSLQRSHWQRGYHYLKLFQFSCFSQCPTNHMIRCLKIRFKIRFDQIMNRILDYKNDPNQITNRIFSFKIYRIPFRI